MSNKLKNLTFHYSVVFFMIKVLDTFVELRAIRPAHYWEQIVNWIILQTEPMRCHVKIITKKSGDTPMENSEFHFQNLKVNGFHQLLAHSERHNPKEKTHSTMRWWMVSIANDCTLLWKPMPDSSQNETPAVLFLPSHHFKSLPLQNKSNAKSSASSWTTSNMIKRNNVELRMHRSSLSWGVRISILLTVQYLIDLCYHWDTFSGHIFSK